MAQYIILGHSPHIYIYIYILTVINVEIIKLMEYIYILNAINIEIIKLMEIYTFLGIDRDYQIIGNIYCFLG